MNASERYERNIIVLLDWTMTKAKNNLLDRLIFNWGGNVPSSLFLVENHLQKSVGAGTFDMQRSVFFSIFPTRSKISSATRVMIPFTGRFWISQPVKGGISCAKP